MYVFIREVAKSELLAMIEVRQLLTISQEENRVERSLLR